MSLSVRWFGWLLVLAVAYGVVARLDGLDEKSLWADELFTLAIAKYHPLLPEAGKSIYRRTTVNQILDGDSFLTAKAAEQSPPLYDILVKISLVWLDGTELVARLPAAFASCMLLFWYACFAWRHPDPEARKVLHWSLMILALHPTLIMYARDGRAYSLGVSLMGMAGLLWMLRWRHGWRGWTPPGWLEIGLFTLACYSHYHAAMLVAMLLSADAVIATKRSSSRAWSRLLLLGLLFAVWLGLNAHTILFTSQGGVAWGQVSPWDRLMLGAQDSLTALHPSWLALTVVIALSLSCMRSRAEPPGDGTIGVRVLTLASISVVYIVLAGLVAAMAGMAHLRFFIFIVPFVAVAMALVCSKFPQNWSWVLIAALLVALSAPTQRANQSVGRDDFRGMALSAVRGSDQDTVFVYSLVFLRDVYRVYLERFLKEDPRARMIGINSPHEAAQVCEQIKGYKHVVAFGHSIGKSFVDDIYRTCGVLWSDRVRDDLHNTFAEHWRAR